MLDSYCKLPARQVTAGSTHAALRLITKVMHPAAASNDASLLPFARVHASSKSIKYSHQKIIKQAEIRIVAVQYIIIGSANINQRSMDGSRDTEIAMGAFQPKHCTGNTKGNYPRGQVSQCATWHLQMSLPRHLDSLLTC